MRSGLQVLLPFVASIALAWLINDHFASTNRAKVEVQRIQQGVLRFGELFHVD